LLARAYQLAAVVLRPVFRLLGVVLGVSVEYLFLPLYKVVVLLRLRVSRVLVSARGFFFLLFTNRYVLHAVIFIISIVTIGGQLQTKYATASDIGQRSLLYAMVTDQQAEVVEEVVYPAGMTQGVRYLGSETLEALPGIDFDYVDVDQPIADLTVPGSIAILPGADDPGIPGDAPVPVRTKTETYVVESGDTVASIARRHGVTVGTVLWANKLTERSTIQPGAELKIPPVSGVLHAVKKGETLAKIAATYGVAPEVISEANQLSGALSIGAELVVPGGRPPAVIPVATRTSATRPDVPISRIANKAVDIYQELTGTKADVRDKPEDVVEAETKERPKLLWPTALRVINQYYGWRHTGVDIDGDYKDPIYASEDGVVETAGWNSGGYGLQIVINHQNGMKTRYAHASKLFVKVGQAVKRGEVIAMVGTTGRSTGTHLHYEVYVGGVRKNPLAYTK
jgi:murein DD-endopeptidase MepM/ murein hydrolase activator NlpD